MTIQKNLSNKAHIFTALLMIIQPIMDIISFWFDKFGISGGITLVMRLGVLAFTLLFAYIITDRKYIYWTAFAVVVLLYTGHALAIWQAGLTDIVSDFSNYIRVVQTPLCAICLVTCMRKNKHAFTGMQWGMTVALWIILAVMIISFVTGTDPGMYRNGTNFYNSGILGWFNNTNSQSSNLSVLLPVAVVCLLNAKKRNMFLFYTTLFIGLTALFFACTRLAYLGIVGVTVGIGFMIFILKRKDWKHGVIMLVFAMLFVGLVPVSPMTKHLNIYNDQQSVRQESLYGEIDDMEEVRELISNAKKGKKKLSDEEKEKRKAAQHRKLIQELAPVYKIYISDFVQIFGYEDTMEMYNYTMDVKTLSALRAKKLMFASALMNRSPASARIFGLEYSRFTVNQNMFGEPLLNSTGDKEITEIYDVENDFHGIYYLYGWAGLLVYVAFILYFLYLVVWAFLKDMKKYYTLEAIGLGIGLLVCLAHAYNTAGVLRRPNASIFLSALLAGIYYLVIVEGKNADLPKLPPKNEIEPWLMLKGFVKKLHSRLTKKKNTATPE